MKVLVTGASGLLGKYLVSSRPEFVEDCRGTHLTNPITDYEMDITDSSSIFSVINDFRPNVVIHCAANGSVDAAETNRNEVIRVNYHGVIHLAKILSEFNSPLMIYVSTNAVYDGTNPPYTEKSMRKSVNEYGYIKHSAENYLSTHYKNHIIVRPYMLFGWPYEGGRQNWATTIIRKSKAGESLNLVNDIKWQPTYAGDCARVIWRIMEKYEDILNYLRHPPNTGFSKESFNVSSGETVSLYEFGLRVCEKFQLNNLKLSSVDSLKFSKMSKRPKDTSYDISKIERLGIRMMTINEGLQKMKEEKQ